MKSKLKTIKMKAIALATGLSMLLSHGIRAQTWTPGTSSLNVNPTTTKVGIGTTSPGNSLSFTDISTSTGSEGITWYSANPSAYGIYKTNGAWGSGPTFQQLKLAWETGIVLYPGSGYWAKSYVDIQGGGLRVSSGNTGLGTTSPSYKLHVKETDAAMINNPMFQMNYYGEPTHTGSYFEYTATTKSGVNSSVSGYNLNNAPSDASTSAAWVEGIGVFGKADRTAPSPSATTLSTGVKGVAVGNAYFLVGGTFKATGGNGTMLKLRGDFWKYIWSMGNSRWRKCYCGIF
jgi:hypothetical protein